MPNQKTLTLRAELKSRRNAINTQQRIIYQQSAWNILSNTSLLKQAQKVACYFSVKGEFPTDLIIQQLWQRGKKIYLPILSTKEKNTLAFQLLTLNSQFKKNQFGITEPVENPLAQVPPENLDLVITPLVGFDAELNRMGMGGGFYDRSFAFSLNALTTTKPWMLGLAFDEQESSRIDRNEWDVPMNAILTQSRLLRKPN